jgi:glyoxylase-like metal-dependent hydrolase (beta-lactamase superfamily II)
MLLAPVHSGLELLAPSTTRLPGMADTAADTGFVEIAERCWVARSALLDLTVGLVGGDRGLLVVDSQTSEAAARRMVEQIRALRAGDVVAVVNTHGHAHHTVGNVVLTESYDAPPVHAHEDAAVPTATETFSSAKVVDLGDRLVELIHPGRGHSAGDAVVRVGDADVLFAGDLVEESAARGGVPGYGEDCFPMDWPATLDLLIGLLTPATTVVPGHGRPVGRDFVEEQRGAIGVVAETVRDLAGRGVPVGEALASAQWPYPAEALAHAVRRGYAHLPRTSRTLPLI